MGEPVGIVTEIQRFSLHDGPGSRTTFFFKGCPLRCRWCHNPEAIPFGRTLRHRPDACARCGACAAACGSGALTLMERGLTLDRSRCTEDCYFTGRLRVPQAPQAPQALRCAGECPSGALSVDGFELTVGDAVREAMADASMYARTGGGVTLSGGEASAQFEFALALSEALAREGVSVALDTCGHCETGRLLRLSRAARLVLFDLKHADPEAHREWTGVDNRLILGNLRALLESGASVEIRIPVIPGANGDDDSVDALARIVAENPGVASVTLLGYHPLGTAKRNALAPDAPAYEFHKPERPRMIALADRVRGIARVPTAVR